MPRKDSQVFDELKQKARDLAQGFRHITREAEDLTSEMRKERSRIERAVARSRELAPPGPGDR